MAELTARQDALDGWKAIAAHLGRSVRSAQRWERDLGLPVHRIPTPDGGQLVYARVLEIDAWRRRHDAIVDAASPEPPPPPPEAASRRAEVPFHSVALRPGAPSWLWALTAVNVMLGLWNVFGARRRVASSRRRT